MATRPFESKIQDLVYNVDVGVGLRLIKLGLYILFLMSIMVVYTATQFRGLKDAEAMDLAQIGRNLMTSHRLTTQVIRPASMWYLIENSRQHNPMMQQHPDILHPPLYPALLASGFSAFKSAFSPDRTARTFPPEQWVMVPLGHVCTILTGLFVLLLGQRLFDRRVGLLGLTLYFLSDAVWGTSISGTALPLATLLCTAACYFALVSVGHREARSKPLAWLLPLLTSSVLCALAFLTRYGTAVLVPPLALFIGWSFKEKGLRWALLYIGVFLVLISPWLARNYVVSGGVLGLAPYTVLNGDDPVMDNTFERTLAPKIEFGATASMLQARWLTNMARLYSNNLRTMGDGILVALFLTTFFYSFARDHVRRFRWCAALALVLMMAMASLFGQATARLMFVFLPFVLLYGLAFFFILLDRMQIRVPVLRMGIIGALVFAQSLPMIFTLLPPRAGVPYPPYFPPYITHISRMLQPEELLCTDMPWATAWYGNRNSLLLPLNLEQFYDINDYTKRVNGLYFTTLTRDREYVRTLLTGSYRTWFPILEGRVPGDFPLTQGFPLNNLDQLFLTDRPRWQDAGPPPKL